ncbi:MAG: hypothetical protein ACKOC5_04965 [Chloroflexota bacterium]
MAQKSRKQTRSVSRTVSAEEVIQVSGSGSRSFAADFNPDYSQTIKDLRRIGILAGSFFVVLIALAFILP